MRYLGIDYGSKRVGIALSDEEGKFALPFLVLSNDEQLLNKIKKIIVEKGVEHVVLGESKNFKSEDNVIMEAVRQFKTVLEKETALPVTFESELLTSVGAHRMNEIDLGQSRKSGIRLRKPVTRNKMLDASAAALILQAFLDKNK
ncbi:MAG: Holliday junction resolvase RuvX [Candidatus Taylorbacteria bacterium]|nr:Holliday junction resolvase RuvX [Candidatus Taylorbacteria bacterium]